VLRLSIIVLHQDDDAKLENTLLSLLENRNEKHHEIILVHDGSYSDPYRLSEDEVQLIDSSGSDGIIGQINLAISIARSPNVQVLFPGVTVEANWSDEAIRQLANPGIACVGTPCKLDHENKTIYGLDQRALPHRRFVQKQNEPAAPMLCGTIFRKKTLQLVGGLNATLPREGAEIELQLLFAAMELESSISPTSRLSGPRRAVEGLDIGYETGRQCGQIACAFGMVEGSGVEVDSLAKQLSHLAGGLMNPKTVAERLGWVMGIRDRSLAKSIRDRLISAADRLDEAVEQDRISSNNYRRAA
jgi:hypothetical protein